MAFSDLFSLVTLGRSDDCVGRGHLFCSILLQQSQDNGIWYLIWIMIFDWLYSLDWDGIPGGGRRLVLFSSPWVLYDRNTVLIKLTQSAKTLCLVYLFWGRCALVIDTNGFAYFPLVPYPLLLWYIVKDCEPLFYIVNPIISSLWRSDIFPYYVLSAGRWKEWLFTKSLWHNMNSGIATFIFCSASAMDYIVC